MKFAVIKTGSPASIAVGTAGAIVVGAVSSEGLFDRLAEIHHAFPLEAVYFDRLHRRAAGEPKSAARRASNAQRPALAAWCAHRGIRCDDLHPGDFRQAFGQFRNCTVAALAQAAEDRGFGLEDSASVEAVAMFHAVLVGRQEAGQLTT